MGGKIEFHEIAFRIPFFMENDFIRRRCKMCGSYFWTQNPDLENCEDSPCQEYTFIGKQPTKRSYTLEELREALRLAEEIVIKQVSMVSP